MAIHHRNSNFASSRIVLTLACALAFATLSPPSAACAQDAFSCIEELSDDEVSYRIRYIEKDLKEGKKKAARWRYGWMTAWFAMGGVGTWLAVDAARDASAQCPECRDWDKFGWAYLSAGAYFGGLLNAVTPAADVWGYKRINKMDGSTEAARRAKLEYATKTLKKANAVEEFYAGPLLTVFGTIYGVVGGTIKATQWTGMSRGLTAGMFIGPPVLFGLQTGTAPKHAMRSWESYRGIACSSKYYYRQEEGADFDFSLNPAGGSITVSF